MKRMKRQEIACLIWLPNPTWIRRLVIYSQSRNHMQIIPSCDIRTTTWAASTQTSRVPTAAACAAKDGELMITRWKNVLCAWWLANSARGLSGPRKRSTISNNVCGFRWAVRILVVSRWVSDTIEPPQTAMCVELDISTYRRFLGKNCRNTLKRNVRSERSNARFRGWAVMLLYVRYFF